MNTKAVIFVIFWYISMSKLSIVSGQPKRSITKLRYFDTQISWNLAALACRGSESILAEPTTRTMNAVVNHFIHHKDKFWIGVVKENDTIVSAGSCTEPEFIPTIKTADKHCFQRREKDMWESKHCNVNEKFLCQWDEDTECPYENEDRKRLHNSAISGKTSSAPSNQECQKMCSNEISGGQECWATVYYPFSNDCFMYFGFDPYQYEQTGDDDFAILSRKRCFTFQSAVESTRKTPVHQLICLDNTQTHQTDPSIEPSAHNCSSCNSSCSKEVIYMNCTNHTEYINVTSLPITCPTLPTTEPPTLVDCSTCPVNMTLCPAIPVNNCTNATQVTCPTPTTNADASNVNCSTCPTANISCPEVTQNCSVCSPLTTPQTPICNCTSAISNTTCPAPVNCINHTEAEDKCNCTDNVTTTNPWTIPTTVAALNITCPTCQICPSCTTSAPVTEAPKNDTCPVVISNLTASEKVVFVTKLIKQLQINTRNLSSSKRKYVSVADPRPSAQNIGYIGVGLMSSLVAGLFLLDLPHFYELLRNLQYLITCGRK